MALNDIDTESRPQQRIALVAHDGRKQDMREWAEFNRELLACHQLYATGTTGRMLSEELDLQVTRFHSGPFGGDQQIGARIADGGIDLLVFFWDPMEPHPHDHDVKALLRVAVLWNIPVACNRATADFLISSPLMNSFAAGDQPAAAGDRPATQGQAGGVADIRVSRARETRMISPACPL